MTIFKCLLRGFPDHSPWGKFSNPFPVYWNKDASSHTQPAWVRNLALICVASFWNIFLNLWPDGLRFVMVPFRSLLINESVSYSVMFNSLRPHRLQPTRLLCPWNSPGKNTGVGSHSLLQGIFQTQGSNPGLLHCRQILTIWATREALLMGTSGKTGFETKYWLNAASFKGHFTSDFKINF